MNRRARTVLFLFFLISFLILAPALVLYTAGYRYNLQTGRVLQTGSIAVATRPRVSSIILNGTETERTPHIFKRVLPGSYDIELTREQYLPYTTSFEISPGESINLQTIDLLPDSQPNLIKSIAAESAGLHTGSESIAYIANEAGWVDGWIYNAREDSLVNVFRAASAASNGTIDWSAGGNYVSFFYSGTLRVYTGSGESISLNALPQEIQSVYWHPVDDDLLYVKGRLGALEINVSSQEFTELPQATLFRTEDARYSIDNEQGTLSRHVGDRTEYLSEIPDIDLSLIAATDRFAILQDKFSRIHIYNLINEAAPTILPTTSFDLIQNDIVYTDGSEIRIYHLEKQRDELITRIGSRISSVTWGPNGQYLFYATSSGVQAVERETFGDRRYRTELTNLSEITAIWIVEREDSLYLLRETETGTELFSLSID
jgi:WD40 repeat protein